MSADAGSLQVEQRDDRVVALWLDRPAARNALDPGLVTALQDAFARGSAYWTGSSPMPVRLRA